jgi:hypothetical protein
LILRDLDNCQALELHGMSMKLLVGRVVRWTYLDHSF